jgi:hypothetical protein
MNQGGGAIMSTSDWITPKLSGINFFATGQGTWTVESDDVITFAYLLEGRTLRTAASADVDRVPASACRSSHR